LAQHFSTRRRPSGVKLSIGDDAAILSPNRQNWVWTVDACVEGVHFDWNWLGAEDVGWRSYQAAVSDIAAMGAKPVAALSSLALPADADTALWRGLARGQARAARALGCPIIGGNLSRAKQVSIHTTVLGSSEHPLRRSGAKPGDEIWLVGNIGLATAGLAVLQQVPEARRSAAMLACVRAWRRPKALVEEGLKLCHRAHAAIDVSDGVAGDMRHLSESSQVSVVLFEDELRQAILPKLTKVAAAMGHPLLDWVLFGGEDYALLAAGPTDSRPAFARRIGCVERGKNVWLELAGGERQIIGAAFDHFRPK
jgi:thiamine-monophosphate kinase